MSDAKLFEGVLEFQRSQHIILENYRYPLKEGEELFGIHRPEVLRYVEKTITALESGTIASWDKLIESDINFMRNYVSNF